MSNRAGRSNQRRNKGRSNVPAKRQAEPVPQALPLNFPIGTFQITQSTHFQGPIPPPAVLAEYDALLPGLANRIVGMAESEQTFRQGLVSKGLRANVIRDRLGQILAFSVVTIVAAFAFILIDAGHTVGGTTLGSVDLVGLAALFLRQERSEKKA